MNEFLKRKNIEFSWKRYGVDALSFMALGLFVSLISGLIMKEMGNLFAAVLKLVEIGNFFQQTGELAMSLTGATIGVAIAYGLKAPILVQLSSAICGLAGYKFGGPIGAGVAAIVGAEVGKIVSKETKIDILITPMTTILVGVFVGQMVGAPLDKMMTQLGVFIMWATELQPFLMGIILAVVMGMILTLPISSAALCIMLGLTGLAGGAAAAGCSAQMVGFAVASYRENRIEGLLSQGLGTSMLQIANIAKNPKIGIPAIVASAIVGPLSTVVFKMTNTAVGAGMGTSGLVGQVSALSSMGYTTQSFLSVGIVHFFIPALVAIIVSNFLRKKMWIKEGDMKLELGN